MTCPVLTLVLGAVATMAAVPRGEGALRAQAAAVTTAATEQQVPVATRRLPRGTVLRESDVSVARVVARGTVAPVGPGWVTRRVIEAGEVLRPPAVAPRPLVAAGAPVRYVIERPGMRLSIDGRATSAGALGDRIAVRLGANRRVEGIVTGVGEVSAPDSTRTS